MAEYQAHETALESSMDLSQVCIMAGSKCSCPYKKHLKCLKNPRDASSALARPVKIYIPK